MCHGRYPPVDVIFLDEYHLPSPVNLWARMLLTSVSAEPRNVSVLMASATPPDEEPPAVRLSGLTVTRTGPLDPFSKPLEPYFRRSCLRPFGNGVHLIIVDCCSAAHSLVVELNSLGDLAAALCPCVNPEAAAHLLSNTKSNYTLVATPHTEAGLDVDCSHYTTTNEAVRMVYQSGVLMSQLVSLAPKQTVQRLGRAGRSRHTLVYSAESRAPVGSDDPSEVDCAVGCLLVLASTGRPPETPEATIAFRRFPRLKTFSAHAAKLCVEQPDPATYAYTINNRGELYSEFGGTAAGYADDCGPEMRLFAWPGGMAFSPYLDLTRYHRPGAGQNQSSVLALAEALHKSRGSPTLSLTAALSSARAAPSAFAPYIWKALLSLEGPTNLSGSLPTTRASAEYMFGSVGSQWWAVLAGLGGSIAVRPHTNGDIDRICSWQGSLFSYCSSTVLGPDSKVDDQLVSDLLSTHLKPIAIIYAFRDDPSTCTDLSAYSSAKARSQNSWFTGLPI
jgi:hypothetical protein